MKPGSKKPSTTVSEAAEKLARTNIEALRDAQAIYDSAMEAGSYQAAQSALAFRHRMAAELARVELAAAAAGMPLELRLDIDAILATGDGSWGALTSIRKLQANYAEILAKHEAARREAALEDQSASDLMDMLTSAIAEMSVDDARTIADAALARVTPRLVGG